MALPRKTLCITILGEGMTILDPHSRLYEACTAPFRMSAVDQADYFSKQVVRTRRFFLPDWRERRRLPHSFCLVGGGCEWSAADYVIQRQTFPYSAVEFVSRG